MNEEGWTIRRARSDEAALLSALAYRSKAVWGYSHAFMERCRPILTVTTEAIAARPVWVAEEDGEVAGFYALGPCRAGIELDLLFVQPTRLGRGIGAALLAHAADEARRLGYAILWIESDPGAEGFYRRAGARPVGRSASPVEEGRTLPLLALDLDPPRAIATPASSARSD